MLADTTFESRRNVLRHITALIVGHRRENFLKLCLHRFFNVTSTIGLISIYLVDYFIFSCNLNYMVQVSNNSVTTVKKHKGI